MKLEDLRFDDLGKVYAWVPRLGDNKDAMVKITYPEYCTNAFYLTCQQIEQLEISKTIVSGGNTVILAVGLWFIAIEAFVNSILRVCCLLRGSSFTEHKQKDVGQRIKVLLEFLSVDRLPLYRTIFQRLEEFKQFRNELFHDKTNEEGITFHKTLFSSFPIYANQVDAMQATIIALEVFNSFRYVLSGKDLMPNIAVEKESSFFYNKLDVLYNQLLCPYFLKVLHKHSLSSALPLGPNVNALPESNIAKKDEVEFLIKAAQDTKYRIHLSSEHTTIGKKLMKEVSDQEARFDPDVSYGLPNYEV